MAKATTTVDERGNALVEDPPIARFLFSNTRMAWIWLLARLWLGWAWIESGSQKITDPAWMDTGVALKSFWERALAVSPAGKPVIAVDWFQGFIQTLYDAQAWTWMARLIACAEVLIGVALILGLFTGLAAFGGSLLNWMFVMAGTASTNMLLFGVAVLLILAWKIGGWYGLDRWVLTWLGTPWAGGRLNIRRPDVPRTAPPPVPA
jgi:thiosulfate dehydrogenase (quinone) large subunit